MTVPRRAHGVPLALACALALATLGAVSAFAAPPTVTITSPANGSSYEIGSTVLADYECAENGAPVVSCVGDVADGASIDTATLGVKQFTVTSTSNDPPDPPPGNEAVVTNSYTVVDTVDPSPPVLANPANGDLTRDDTPLLQWAAATDLGGSGIDEHAVLINGDLAGNLGPGATSFTTAPLSTGEYSWQIFAADVAGNTSASEIRSFAVDTTAPGPPTITQQPVAVSPPGTTHVFAWTGDGDPTFGLGVFNWQVRDSAGQIDASGTLPATGGSGQVAVDGLAANDSYVFEIQQVDQAGNPGQVGLSGVFTIELPPPDLPTGPGDTPRPRPTPGSASGSGSGPSAPPTIVPVPGVPSVPSPSGSGGQPAPATGDDGPQRVAPATLNAKRLRPKAGVLITSRRPRLRWPKVGEATVYNVQIFRMDGTRFAKVYSGFPKRNRLRVPEGKLERGERYAWRVWPFRGRKALKKPVGASYFDVRTKKQIFASRLIRPKSEIVAGERAQFWWAKRRGIKQYRFRLLTDGKRTYQGITRRNRSTVPAKRLAKAGDYTVLVQLGVGRPKAKKFGTAWIRLPIEVLTQAELTARRRAESG